MSPTGLRRPRPPPSPLWAWIPFAAGLAACEAPAPAHFETRSLSLARSATLAFAICNDSRGKVRPWEPDTRPAREALVRRLVELHPSAVINAGDMVAFGALATSWEAFDEEYGPLRAAGIRYLPGLGNHEYLGPNDQALRHYFARFPFLFGRRYYAWNAGPLEVIVLDDNLLDQTEAQRAEQSRWLEAELARADADPEVSFVLLAAHHPPFSNGERPGDPAVEAFAVAPARRSRKARILLSGHAHSYERFERDGFTYVVSGGCGAPLRAVETEPGAWRHEPAFKGPALRGHHYLDCRASRSKLACEVVELTGEGWRALDHVELGAPPAGP